MSPSHDEKATLVIVVRHGERLDYAIRDGIDGMKKGNWVSTARRPWDPPLTNHGKLQAETLGEHLAATLRDLLISNNLDESMEITAVYSSPFRRCRETAMFTVQGMMKQNHKNCKNQFRKCGEMERGMVKKTQDGRNCQSNLTIPIRVEMGLAESINSDWYQAWALPGSDGTWGFRPKNLRKKANLYEELNPECDFHPASREPVQNLLNDWRVAVEEEMQEKEDEKKKSSEQNEHASILAVDLGYDSQSSIAQPYTFYPALLETHDLQAERMEKVVNQVSEPGKVVVLVSHGGPVTHLFGKLTGSPWYKHGQAKYCCYSVYRKKQQYSSDHEDDNQAIEKRGGWEALVVNNTDYLK